MFIQPHVATQDDVSLLLDDAIGKGFAVIGINEDPTILMIVAVSKGAHAERSILGDSFPAAGNGGVQAFSPPVICLVAERCWDRVRWAIEEYTWRFDGSRRPPRAWWRI
jgi:hypothetical protein